MPAAQPHVGQIGLQFSDQLVDQDGVPIDISTATLVRYDLEDPQGRTKSLLGQLRTDGQDGRILAATASAGDLDQAGQWKRQAYVVLASGQTLPSAVLTFTVARNLV